jgi:nitrate reductase (NAD(P)H)
MMESYHIGSLDEVSRKVLAEGEPVVESTEPRPVFLDTRVWNKSLLHAKVAVSWDTRIFTFKLEHDEQPLGLPTGQHLMIRLRDPVTREAIIRSYTPVSQTTKKGYCDVLVKVYFDSPEKQGGKMTKALDSIPVGHFVEFKGPIGKFEYISRGLCSINGKKRNVKRFFMICGGSGITPIFQVLRAIMQDKEDPTTCVVLDGNRLIEDILCKEDLDVFARDNVDRCKLLYTLTKGPEDWQGRRGRIDAPLLLEHCMRGEPGESLVLVCGPEALEKNAHKALNEQGWPDEELLFF